MSLKRKFKHYFFANINFESDIQYWNNSEAFLTDNIIKDGNYSNKLCEYSETLSFPLDSILTSKNLLIRSKLSVYYEDKTMAKIVFTIEDKEKVYLLEAKVSTSKLKHIQIGDPYHTKN